MVADGPIPVPEPIVRALRVARRHMGMDVSYVAAFEDGKQVFRAMDGEAPAVGLDPAGLPPLSETICARMASDESLRVIPDVRSDARVSDVPTARGIGAYVGVPLVLADGTLYGSLCCVSRERDGRLSDRDVVVLQVLADLIAGEVEQLKARSDAAAPIRTVLAQPSIDVALQPIVSLVDGRCVGVEALSRFPAPLGAPDVVFAAAHDAGLGLELERLAIASAFALLDSLAPGQFLAVNCAPDVVVQLAAEASAAVDAPYDRVVLEITEHAAVANYHVLRDALGPLRARGLRLAIDDAGAGFASLHHVVELRPDVIKVDGSLVEGVSSDAARRTVVASFVLLGAELDALVLAEGVETEEDLAAVRRLGVTAAQGYLFARPSSDPLDHARWARQAAR